MKHKRKITKEELLKYRFIRDHQGNWLREDKVKKAYIEVWRPNWISIPFIVIFSFVWIPLMIYGWRGDWSDGVFLSAVVLSNLLFLYVFFFKGKTIKKEVKYE